MIYHCWFQAVYHLRFRRRGVSYGTIEENAGVAIKNCVDTPGYVDLSDWYFIGHVTNQTKCISITSLTILGLFLPSCPNLTQMPERAEPTCGSKLDLYDYTDQRQTMHADHPQ